MSEAQKIIAKLNSEELSRDVLRGQLANLLETTFGNNEFYGLSDGSRLCIGASTANRPWGLNIRSMPSL